MRPLLAVLLLLPSPSVAQTVRLSVIEAPVSISALPQLSSPLAARAPLSVQPLALTAALPAPSIVPVVSATPAPAPALAQAVSAAPSAPNRPAAPDSGRFIFDGTVAHPDDEAEPVAASYARPVVLGRTKAPNHWVEKGKAALAYGGLTASAAALHAPFDRIGPIVAAIILAVPMGFGLLAAIASARSAKGGARPASVSSASEPSAETLEMAGRLAQEAGLPPALAIKLLASADVQAMVGGSAGGYALYFSEGFEKLPADQREAIVRHELGHVLHHDAAWAAAQSLLVMFPIMIAMVSGAVNNGNWLSDVLAISIIAVSILLLPSSLQHSEYMADQYAASRSSGAGPLARFFRDQASPGRSGFAGMLSRLAEHLYTHPSHEKRAERLIKTARKPRPSE